MLRIVEELHDCLEVLAAAPPAPWKERVAALRGLQALAESDDVYESAARQQRLAQELAREAPVLVGLIQDSRPATVRQACTTIESLAESLQAAFDPLVLPLLPPLLLVAAGASPAVARAAEGGVLTVVRCCAAPRKTWLLGWGAAGLASGGWEDSPEFRSAPEVCVRRQSLWLVLMLLELSEADDEILVEGIAQQISDALECAEHSKRAETRAIGQHARTVLQRRLVRTGHAPAAPGFRRSPPRPRARAPASSKARRAGAGLSSAWYESYVSPYEQGVLRQVDAGPAPPRRRDSVARERLTERCEHGSPTVHLHGAAASVVSTASSAWAPSACGAEQPLPGEALAIEEPGAAASAFSDASSPAKGESRAAEIQRQMAEARLAAAREELTKLRAQATGHKTEQEHANEPAPAPPQEQEQEQQQEQEEEQQQQSPLIRPELDQRRGAQRTAEEPHCAENLDDNWLGMPSWAEALGIRHAGTDSEGEDAPACHTAAVAQPREKERRRGPVLGLVQEPARDEQHEGARGPPRRQTSLSRRAAEESSPLPHWDIAPPKPSPPTDSAMFSDQQWVRPVSSPTDGVPVAHVALSRVEREAGNRGKRQKRKKKRRKDAAAGARSVPYARQYTRRLLRDRRERERRETGELDDASESDAEEAETAGEQVLPPSAWALAPGRPGIPQPKPGAGVHRDSAAPTARGDRTHAADSTTGTKRLSRYLGQLTESTRAMARSSMEHTGAGPGRNANRGAKGSGTAAGSGAAQALLASLHSHPQAVELLQGWGVSEPNDLGLLDEIDLSQLAKHCPKVRCLSSGGIPSLRFKFNIWCTGDFPQAGVRVVWSTGCAAGTWTR